MSHIFTSAREIRRDDNLPIKNMITFKLKIKFLFKVTKKCTATQHQPSFLETFPLVLTNPTGYNFLSTGYQLRWVAEFFHKEIKIRLSSLRVGWPQGTTWVQSLCLMGGRPRKWWNAIDVPLEGRTVPQQHGWDLCIPQMVSTEPPAPHVWLCLQHLPGVSHTCIHSV